MQRLFALIALAIVLYGVKQFCDKETDGFRLERIRSSLTHNSAWEVEALSAPKAREVASALAQNFSYLASGGQCYAFASLDGRYVLKFFKHFHRELPWWSHLPLSKRQREKLEGRKKKLQRDFSSYTLAFKELQEETGLLLIHLNKTAPHLGDVTLIDKLGIAHTIALDAFEFVLQYKAEMALPYLAEAVAQRGKEGVRAAICSMLEVLQKRCAKGIFDEDPRIQRNVGFVHGRAIILDAGRLRLDPERKKADVQKSDLRTITERLRGWLKEHYPEGVEVLNEELEALHA